MSVLRFAAACAIASTSLIACAEATETSSADTPACEARAEREILFDAAPHLRLTASVDGEHCAEAPVLVTLRESGGALAFTNAFPLKALALTEPPSPDTAGELMAAFKDNIVLREAGDMEPYASATQVSADNPTPLHILATKRVYERARRIGGVLICFPVHYETASCVWRDPEHGGVFHLYYSGG